MTDNANDDVMAALREFQDSGYRHPMMSFEEFRQNPMDLIKSIMRPPPTGGMNAQVGMMGHLSTSSYAPTGPNSRPSNRQGTLMGALSEPPRSKYYTPERPMPTPWIDDVDLSNTWYSPMQPVWPYGPPTITRPKEWNFPVGYNINFIPQRMQTYGMLEGMRSSWGVLATIIETRKDQLLRLPWTIQIKNKPRGKSAAVDEVRKFFRRPDGKLSYSQWSRKLLDDLFVIDAPTLYIDRMMSGKVRNVEVLQGSTIFPLIDDMGRRPDSTYTIDEKGIVYEQRQPAFQQIIYGLPAVDLSEDELIYAHMRPRPELPMYGFSPVEQIMIEATEAIRKTFYQLEFWRSGSMPELIVTVPDTWTPRQIAMFQAHFDALMSGQLALKSKVRFLPGGMKPFDIKNASGESLWSQRDEMLIRLACYAFSVSPTPFIQQSNRATANNAQQTAQEEGLYPLMSWWKDDIMDVIIQDKLGFEDIEFVYLPRPEVDLTKQSQIHKEKVQTGEMTLDEARAESGEEPYPDGLGSVPLIITGAGAFRLKDIIEGNTIMPGGMPPKNDGTPGGDTKPIKKDPVIGGPAKPSNASPMPTPTPVHKALTHRDIKDAAREADRHPSSQQKKNGNYAKGHIWLNGLNISIENAKGSKRGEKDKFGRGGEVKMPAAYGYIRGTIGADGMQVDCYLGKHPESELVFVFDQDKFNAEGDDKGFDEHKVMLGYKDPAKAVKDYCKSHYDGFGHERIAAITAMDFKTLKKWLKKGDMMKPCNEQGFGQVIAHRGDKLIGKADTISSATNLSWYDQNSTVYRKKKKKRNAYGNRWLALR